MASYDLNDVLKKKDLNTHNEEHAVALDDVSRVKVLSPTRQVIKRFLRNRLAVFGFVSILVLFVFCFIGPIFYQYGQKETFYKYDTINIKLGVATESTSFTGYTVDSSIKVETNANSYMTTNIKTMQSAGLDDYIALYEDGNAYEVVKEGENVYTLGQRSAEKVATFGTSEVEWATYDGITRTLTYTSDGLDEDREKTVTSSLKGNSGSFTIDGVVYNYKKTTGKNYAISRMVGGFVYSGSPLAAAFESTVENAQVNQVFSYDGKEYFVSQNGDTKTVYSVGAGRVARVFTTYVIDLYDNTKSVSDEFRNNALLAVYSSDTFTADGREYRFVRDDDSDAVEIFDSEGKEIGEFSTFIIRRTSGEDTIPYEAKQDIAAAIYDMLEEGSQNTAFETMLPEQTEDGKSVVDEDGNYTYVSTEIRVNRTDRNYELWAYQITYVIDRFASPSWSHILGTDGDGFDVFARVMYGGRVSLMVGFVVVFIELILGIILGGLAGYYGGWVDNIVMRLVDIFYCLPSTPIMIILGSIMDAMRMDVYTRLFIMMAALGIMGWAGVARLVRGQILSFREQEFMIAAEATGIKVKDRIFKHLIPNVMPQLIVIATMGVGGTIITESTLSFLGLGVKHPLATWGTMINSVSSASAMAHYAYIWIPVGLLISFTVISFNFVGDGLRDAYDPKGKR